ncbi:hypothetical protein C7271_25465 [filamentous cyanobacterium CCP5]|nr:hypothetical protein C7271_25465 [filamentous cyanobacterium CCP5]
MNTPSHIIINLAILRRPLKEATWPVIWGAIAPDFAMFVFFAWARGVQRLGHREIWHELYHEPFWQNIFAVGNSIPLGLVGLGLSYRFKQVWGMGFFASMLLHHLEDLPLHNEDAHRHFWPLSDGRIFSPISYWDARSYGWLGSGLELVLVLAASGYLWWQVRSRIGRGLMILFCLLYLWEYLESYVLRF